MKNEPLKPDASLANSLQNGRIMPQRFLQTVTWPCLLTLLFVSSQTRAGDILVKVEGKQAIGALHLALVPADQPEWDGQILRQLQSGETELRLTDVPPGRYAVQLFQDLDGDGTLALSPRGVPREPVGFSSNPALFKGKPKPPQCLFEHGSGDTLIVVKLRGRR
ncbi:DUF2141 domain-containing protein [Pseudomonas sp. Gutcm_11s]|uniref:DUF2141 domain-containing protein n=1 Tax=Pseudomonas sp. Gutcm_11s TaxID=3026088 RepID=UPI00235F879E|nr:DUF2141 domain-containing protein [Pseudomonas sp. Gutcm_11s]MDD0845291.1 DUF2141 domain-containing protein [Pseudomonas sp. Gutcm_11s]